MKQKNALIIGSSIIIASIIIVVGIKSFKTKTPMEICFEENVKKYSEMYEKSTAMSYAMQNCK